MGHPETISFFIDPNIATIVIIGGYLLLGLGLIGCSVYIRLRGLPGSPETWQNYLITWRILGPNTLPQTLTEVKRCWEDLISMSTLASGMCIVLVMVGWSIIELATVRMSADSMNPNNPAVFLASFFLSLGIGLGAGAVFGAWRLRNIAKRSVTYANLRPRRLSDYRSNAFRWISGAMIVWTIGVLLFFAPHVGATLQIPLFLSTVMSVPNTVWGLSIVPSAMLFVFIVGEIVLSRIVGFSRLLVTSDTTVSQHTDDMLRATVIGSVQYFELIALGQLGSLPYSLLTQHLWVSHYWQIGHLPYSGLLTVSLFMPVAMQFLGLGIILGRGRLGGKISGWPWQTNQIKQLAGEQ